MAMLFHAAMDVSALDFKDFSGVDGLVLNGAAKAANTTDGVVLRLTPSIQDQAGSVFSLHEVSISQFQTYFRFRISGDLATYGADGFAFVIQVASPKALGSWGGSLGYVGIIESIAVEFDTWQNPAFNDPDESHIAILTAGSVVHEELNDYSQPAPVLPPLDNGEIWNVWIKYDGERMDVRVNSSSNLPSVAALSATIDLPEIIGQRTAYVGLTAATGGCFANHDILSWNFREGELDQVD
jgi:hypothetical protein